MPLDPWVSIPPSNDGGGSPGPPSSRYGVPVMRYRSGGLARVARMSVRGAGPSSRHAWQLPV